MPKVKKHKSVLAAKQSLTKPVIAVNLKKKHKRQKPQQQQQQQQQQQSTRPRELAAATAKAPKAKASHAAAWPQEQWRCASIIDQQSSEALLRLLAAAETRTAGATIKSLTLAPHIVHKKPTYAVTVETLKHLPLLKAVLAAVELLQQHQKLPAAAAYVLTYELLFGQGFRQKGPAEVAVLAQQGRLQGSLQSLLQQAGVPDAAAWLAAQQQQPQRQQQQQMVPHPRFARVNTLKASVEQVLTQLLSEATSVSQQQQQQQQAGQAAGAAGTAKQKRQHHGAAGGEGTAAGPVVDALLPDVLVFQPGTDLHDHPLVQQGVLILQSKASCMPAHALQPQPGWHVVDCCAAPGNKTTHVAALLAAAGNARACNGCGSGADGTGAAVDLQSDEDKCSRSSKKRTRQQSGDAEQAAAAAGPARSSSSSSSPRVFAFDKDPKRLKRLQANVARTAAGGIVLPRQADFLTLDPTAAEFAQVQGVILDPSCSGSGTVVSRMDHLLPQAEQAEQDGAGQPGGGSSAEAAEQQRVEQLAKFQEAAVLHALRFPALQRLVYSTCSVHQRENEDVVAAVLPAAAAAGLRLVDPFPAWHRRGLPVVQGAELLVRTDPYQDGTDGFFVAVFERE